MNVGHVQGGTHAGWKIQRPAPKPWVCECTDERYSSSQGKVQPAYMTRCTDCGVRRP